MNSKGVCGLIAFLLNISNFVKLEKIWLKKKTYVASFNTFDFFKDKPTLCM